jgi:NADH-quinone oxidoreductase subunit A
MLYAFSGVLAFILLSVLFVAGAMLLSALVRPNKPNREKQTTYECGEEPVGEGWIQYNVRFYIINSLWYMLFGTACCRRACPVIILTVSGCCPERRRASRI